MTYGKLAKIIDQEEGFTESATFIRQQCIGQGHTLDEEITEEDLKEIKKEWLNDEIKKKMRPYLL